MSVLDAYQRLAKGLGLPEMQQGGLQSESQDFDEPQKAWRGLRDHRPVQGWVLLQSHQGAFRDGLPEPAEDWGAVLAAEALAEDGAAVHLTYGQGRWRLHHHRHQEEGDWLWDQVIQMAHDPKTGRLRYRRYWRREEGHGYVQRLACFIGFE